ncbi:pyridoxal 5'-phosphate synthase glutaminase subunit PdxT [Oscillospiraceae bacterium WX1]
MKIGVLALQGGFIEHVNALERLGAAPFEIRNKRDLDSQDMRGLILPGGESTVIGKLLRETALFGPLKERIDGGLPVFGTCAGMILLAKEIVSDTAVYFGAINIAVKRNAFGRQLGSFQTTSAFSGIGEIPMTFIRAPFIEKSWGEARILASASGHPVAAEQGNILVTAFHPELTDDLRVHDYFLKKAEQHF